MISFLINAASKVVALVRLEEEGKVGRVGKGGGEWGGNQERIRLLVLCVDQTLGFNLIRTRVRTTTKNISRT